MSGDDRPEGPITTPAGRPGASGWTRAVLIGSLLLNLILIGAIAGAGLRERSEPRRHPGGDAVLGLLFEALPEGAKRDLRRDMVASLPDRGDIRRAAREDTRALLDAVRAEPFDRAAVAAALARQRGRAEQLLEVGAGIVLVKLEAMSAAERRAYADALEQAIRRRAPVFRRD